MDRRGVWTALAEELALIRGSKAAPTIRREDYTAAALGAFQSALCLSGGGIRSAAFAFGALQALAKHRLLAGFDYLSTVSGGGFAGAWLMVLLRQAGSAERVEQILSADPPARPFRALRDYTNYLTPRPGGFSLDTWVAIGLYLRNIFLNWLVFTPALALLVVVAILYRTLLWRAGLDPSWSLVLISIGALSLLLATARGCLAIPSHRPVGAGSTAWLLRWLPDRLRVRLLRWFGASDVPAGAIGYTSPAAIASFIVAPALVWAVLGPMTLAGWYKTGVGTGMAVPLVHGGVLLGGYGLAMVWTRELGLYLLNASAWFLSTIISALLLWLGVWLGASVPAKDQAEVLAVAGPLWFVLAQLVQTTVHVGFRRSSRMASLDREWLIRLSAMKLRPIVFWSLFAFCALSLSRLGFGARNGWPFWAVALASTLTGPGGAWLGKQAITRVETLLQAPTRTDRFFGLLLPSLAGLFAIGLAMLAGGVMARILGFLQIKGADLLSGPAPPGLLDAKQEWLRHWNDWYFWLPLPLQGGMVATLAILLVSASTRINVNRFSLHDVYRNRLARAFLGSARASRQPDPFTRFDPEDNERLSDLVGQPPRKLFHVINVTLNLTSNTALAWLERKAASFTMTPLACGSAVLRMPDQADDEEPRGVYVPPGDYAGSERETGRASEAQGMSLATAMTLSGAAVSPNWGYHSSPATAFLMTLFNLRLGAWLPNPAVARTAAALQRSAPRFSLMPMLNELLGRTSDCTAEIYLSDGGHFENLGLYEMLRRRCRRILVLDAGEDADAQLTDLGIAIRRSAIDLDVKITMLPMSIRSRIAAEALPEEARAGLLGFAVGVIRYPEGRCGQLIYLKPSWLDHIPAEIRAYGALHPEFPHEPTTDQWFTESQFESYRGLGEFQMSQLLDEVPPRDLAAVFHHATRRIQPRGPQI